MLSTEVKLNNPSNEEGVLYYHEVFLSIQGESTGAGLPCVFIRLFGCNVHCSFCDQPQTSKDRHKISIWHLVQKAMSFGCKNICITGGEPLMQSNEVYQLALELVSDYGCKVAIETNGCIPIPDLFYPKDVKFVMDIKCPSSGVSDKNVFENLMMLRTNDEVKFVISNREDYEYMKKVLKTYPTAAKILVSPVFRYRLGEWFCPNIGKELVNWLIEDKMYHVRVQIQMHRILGVM